MPRLVIKDQKGPQQVGEKHICMCGLSKNQPFCDGSHKQTLDEKEDETYLYTEDGRKVVAEIVIENNCRCHGDKGCDCGHECNCSHK